MGEPRSGAALRYAVVGAGMSGIAAAYHLQARGHRVELFERESGVGGRCTPARMEQGEVTFGGKNIGRRYELFREFTEAMGHHPFEYFGINSARVENGRIRTFDSTRRARSFVGLGRRMTPVDVVRLAGVARRVRADDVNRYLGSRSFADLAGPGDRSLREFFSGRFCDGILRPVTVRMNGAEPDEAYVGNLGTNVAMLLDSYDQLAHGMGPVLKQFTATHHVTTGVKVESLVTTDGAVTGVRVRLADGSTDVRRADGVVIATPALAAADVVREHDPSLAANLAAVHYFPAAVAIARYDRPLFSNEVRALVFPATEPVSNAGVYGVDQRDTVRYTFSGRTARDRIDRADGEELTALAESLLDRHVPMRGARRLELAFQRWPAAYCAYLPEHAGFLTRVRDAVARLPGLALAGDYMRGASIEACFRSGLDCAESLPAAPGAASAPASRATSGVGAA
jgi:oxygen-dependent protoporphyrinogen oxidase